MLAGMVALREQGALSAVSLGMNMVVAPQILRLIRESPAGTFDDIMLAHGWNLLCVDGAEVILECQQRGIAVHNAGVYCSGLLVSRDTYFCSPASEDIRSRAAQWGELSEAHGVALPAVAIAFGLWPSAVSHVVCGMRTEGELQQALGWLEEAGRVPDKLWSEAEGAGMLDPVVVEALRPQ
jgi:D-threo-aldose 1-dehydrogenase